MSILIKGVEMPTCCSDCDIPCDRWMDVEDGNRSDECPLVTVPPHGRLIDADSLMKEGWKLHREIERKYGYDIHEIPINCPSIPTVIPAEESKL